MEDTTDHSCVILAVKWDKVGCTLDFQQDVNIMDLFKTEQQKEQEELNRLVIEAQLAERKRALDEMMQLPTIDQVEGVSPEQSMQILLDLGLMERKVISYRIFSRGEQWDERKGRYIQSDKPVVKTDRIARLVWTPLGKKLKDAIERDRANLNIELVRRD